MKICLIGGTGHIGKNLAALLLEDDADLTVITSGRTPAPQGGFWDRVTFVQGKYGDAQWVNHLKQQQCEVLIDILGSDAPATYAAVKSTCKHFILCGSLWMLGEPLIVPTPATTQSPCLFEGYASRYAQMLALKETASADGIAFTAIMPPNICGPGKIPLDGLGGRDIKVHQAHQRGELVILPDLGTTLIGPCDAFDVAQGFSLAAAQRDRAADHIFNVGSDYALTALQLIETFSNIYGKKIPVELYDWKKYVEQVNPDLGGNYHFKVHMCPDLTKIKARLNYQPRYTPQQTLTRAVDWMREQELL